jgi:hypothetical protein
MRLLLLVRPVEVRLRLELYAMPLKLDILVAVVRARL